MHIATKNQPVSSILAGPPNDAAQSLRKGSADSALAGVASASTGPALDNDAVASTAALQKQANTLVATTFYGTLLKQMHDSPFKSKIFSGGRGGEAFGGMYDQVLATRMAGHGSNRLTHAIVKKYKADAQAAYKRQQKSTTRHLTKEAAHVPHDHRA